MKRNSFLDGVFKYKIGKQGRNGPAILEKAGIVNCYWCGKLESPKRIDNISISATIGPNLRLQGMARKRKFS